MKPISLLALILYGSAGLSAAPAISGVYNGASWLPPALSNSGVAQGSIFTITGTGLGPASLVQAQSYPLPTTQGLGGTSIQVRVGSTTVTCIMVYTLASQVAAILPSATPVGSGTLALTYQGATTTATIEVLAANFGTFTLNEGGTGPAVVTDTSYNAITLVNPAHPGQSLILWGTGLGAVSGDETQPPVEKDLATGVQVLVGNQAASVQYGGRSSSPGLDQINFVVPSNVNGCRTSIAVLVKGVTGNVTTTAVAPSGQATCGDTYGALTAANLQKAVSSGSLSIGLADLSRIGTNNDSFSGGFGNFALNSLVRSFGGSIGPSLGSCVAYETSGSSLVVTDPVAPSYLSGGASITINGPGGSKTVTASSTGQYSGALATAPATYLAPGNYTVANGSGGSGVTGFSANLSLPSFVTPTNLPGSVSRTQDLTLTWSGGANYPVVTIFGYSGVPTSTGINSYVEFICNASGSAGQFTVPAAIVNLLPTNGYGASEKPGAALQIGGDAQTSFTVAGSPGIDAGIFSILVTNGGIVTVR